jgi:hypothetical protein
MFKPRWYKLYWCSLVSTVAVMLGGVTLLKSQEAAAFAQGHPSPITQTSPSQIAHVNPETYNSQGEAQFRQGEFKAALATWQTALTQLRRGGESSQGSLSDPDSKFQTPNPFPNSEFRIQPTPFPNLNHQTTCISKVNPGKTLSPNKTAGFCKT